MNKKMSKANYLFWISCVVLLSVMLFSGCADRYNTQRGAVIGSAVGATSGQAIGRDTKSTLLGAGIGAFLGSLIGNYEDQRIAYENSYKAPNYQAQWANPYSQPQTAYYPPVQRGYNVSGSLVTVPGQYVGAQYVPSHFVWVPPQATGVTVHR